MNDIEILYKMIMDDDPIKEIEDNKELVFKLIPELRECDNYNQMNKFHVYSLIIHILEVVKNCKKDLNTRLAALFHDIGKPCCKIIDENNVAHYLGHSKHSTRIFLEFAERNNLKKEDISEISKLIFYHEDELSLKTNKRLNFIIKFGTKSLEKFFDIKKADILGQNPEFNDRLHRMEFIEETYLNDKKILDNLQIDYNYLDNHNLNNDGVIRDIIIKLMDKELENNTNDINEYVKNKYRIGLSK